MLFVKEDIVKEFREEIRKLKAMIVKHENRIRALEEKAKGAEEEEGRVGDGLRVGRQTQPAPAPVVNDDNQHEHEPYDQDDLAPDEV